MAIRNGSNVVRLVRVGQEVKQVENELAGAQKRNEELKKEFQYVQSDEFVEKEAREKLGLGKPGETVLIIPKEEPSYAKATEGKPNWWKWYELYIGNRE